MTMQHTPGPWRAETGRHSVLSGIALPPLVKAGSMALAIVEGEESIYGDGGTTIARYEANARLMAAAPDLLACLDEFRNHLLRRATTLGINDEERQMLTRSDAAIAKAKGE